jgi:hypothetical protein
MHFLLSDNLWLLFGVFIPFKFTVIINTAVLNSILVIYPLIFKSSVKSEIILGL